jgi:hypothetical protein
LELEDDAPLETWESIDRADEWEQDIVMPSVGGTDAEKAAIRIVLNKFKHVFGKPPIGGSKLRPMGIELKNGGSETRLPCVSPEILKEIRGHADAHRIRLDEGSKDR